MNLTATELKTNIYPTRIIKVQGTVLNPDVLLMGQSPIPVLKQSVVTRLEKTGAENPYILLDFGRELHGSLRLVVAKLTKGKKNISVRLTFGESVSEALSVLGEKGACNDHSPRDFEAILSNLSGVEYGHTGFRFVRIQLIEEGFVDFQSVVAVLKSAAIEQKGYFRTGDDLFNKIIDTATYTCYLNLQDGVIWDGIKRDRLVWSGDLNSEIRTLLYLYGPVEHIRNSLDHLRDLTEEHRWMNTIPSYSIWWVFNHLLNYSMSGDLDYLNANMARINSILRDFDLCVEPNEADFSRTGDKNLHMAYYFDWPTRGTEDAKTGTMLLIYLTAKTVLEMAIDGMDLAAAQSLFDKLGAYLDAPTLLKQTLAFQAVSGGLHEETCRRLEEGGAREFSTFMSYFLLKGMSLSGSTHTLELAKDYYGAMLSRGATTFWEDFDMDWLEGSGRIDEEPRAGERDLHADYGKYCYIGLRHSLCHGWSSGVVGWAIEDILGLKVLAPGYKKVSITPNLMGLDWIEAKIPTPYGDIYVRAEKENPPVITLPEGIEAV